MWSTKKPRKTHNKQSLTPHWSAIFKGKTKRKGRNSANTSLACLPKTSPPAIKLSIGGPACPVTTGSTAAVFWPCKGSAITCLLNRDLYEWLNEGLAVSPFQSVKLIYPCRSGYNTTRREDPLELKVQNPTTSNDPLKSKNLVGQWKFTFGWGDHGGKPSLRVEWVKFLKPRETSLSHRISDQ